MLRIFPQDAQVYADGNALVPGRWQGYYRYYQVPGDSRSLVFTADGYESAVLSIGESHSLSEAGGFIPVRMSGDDTGILSIELKLERAASESSLHRLAIMDSGTKPKSVEFSPDGSRMYVAQLDGNGLDVYDVATLSHLGEIRLSPPQRDSRGFVEIAFRPGSGEIWISQMTTGEVHILDIGAQTPLASLRTGGSWSKVICFSPDGSYVFVSNWLSEDVSVISAADRRLLGRIPVGTVPRGLAISPDGTKLFVSDYEGGRVFRYDIEFLSSADSDSDGDAAALSGIIASARPALTMGGAPGAKRHIVISPRRNRIFVSDMYHGMIFAYSLSDGTLENSVYVGPKLNTIALDPQEKYLYISSRGMNNPETYLIPGPDFGRVYVMDLDGMQVVDWIWGGNQPTGLAVSPDGTRLAFTNFLDDRLEIYDISAYSAINPLAMMYGRLGLEIREGLDRRHELPPAIEFVEEHAEAGTSGG
jgi:YVTN family beta-propeller protein